jgi:hypothetical protein
MGLARIITRLNSGYDAIEKDLRARGYQVERSSPDDPGREPADLEITIEECTAEQALTHAMNDGGDASVFVAPGALAGAEQAIAAIPFVPSLDLANPACEMGREPAMRNPAAFPVSDSSPAETDAVQIVLATDTPIDLAQEIETHENVLAMENQQALQPEVVAPEMQTSEVSLVAGSQEASAQPIVNPENETQTAEMETAPEVSRSEQISEAQQPLETQPVELVTDFERVANVEAHGEETPLDHDVDIEPVQEAVFAASDTAASLPVEAPVPLLDQQPDVAAVPVQLQGENSSIAAGVPSPPSDWPIWQPLAEPAPVQAVQSASAESQVPVELVQQAESRNPRFVPTRRRTPYRIDLQPYRAALKRFSQDDTLFWKTATLASTVAVIAMLVAASFHRFSPVPVNLENPAAESSGEVQQPSSVVETRPRPKLPRAVVKTVAAESIAEPKPPLMEGVRSRTPNASAAEKVGLAASKQKIGSRPQRTGNENAVIAEDTVVRYGATVASVPPPPSPKKPQIKRYSDMN